MAVFTSLPVYKSAYDLLVELHNRVTHFSREHKFTLGEKIKNETLSLIVNIYKANKSKKANRMNYIEQARENIELTRLYIRLCKDLKIIGLKAFVFLNQKIEEVSKQLKGWYSYVTKQLASELKK